MEFKVEYIKDMYKNYLVLIPIMEEEEKSDDYSSRMIVGNKIQGLLMCEKRIVDFQDRYCYDISSKQPIVNVFERGQMDEVQIQKLINGIIETVKEGKRYMLPEGGFILLPEYVYMNVSGFEISLCYLPGYNHNIQEQLSKLLEFVLEKVNHNNQKAIVMSYGLYKLIKGNEVSFESIEEFIKTTLATDEEKPVFTFDSESIDDYIEYDEEEVYADEYEKEEDAADDKRELLCDSYDESKNRDISNKLLIGICVVTYLFIIAVVYLSGILHRNGQLNIPLLICVMFTVLCAVVAIAIMVKQKNKDKLEQRKETLQAEEDTYEQYWNREIVAEQLGEYEYKEKDEWEDEDEDKTILLTEYRKKTGFALRDEKGVVIRIFSFPFVIGKLKEKVDYYIDDMTVSRMHAKIDAFDDGVLMVTDLNSTNGTFVGDRQLRANEVVKISPNETLRIGEHEFILIKEI